MTETTVVFTGRLDSYWLEKIAIVRGMQVRESVSKKTGYLVAGDKPGAVKYAKAKELGIPILTEEEFLALKKPQGGFTPEITVVFTGDLNRYWLEKIVSERGMYVRKDISGKTDYLIAGYNPGEVKCAKARELGIPILSEEEFLALENPQPRTKTQARKIPIRDVERMTRTKKAQALIGICSGIVTDGVLSDSEIAFLDVWLLENPDVAGIWPGEAVAERLNALRVDGVISENRRQELLSFLKAVSGNEFAETGAAAVSAPFAEFDTDVKVELTGRHVVLTGTFSFGSRAKCEEATKAAGASIGGKSVTLSTDYLVVGSGITTSWANTTYGRKIEEAIDFRKRYGKPLVVTEQQWLAAVQP
jgi:NAD-dependent DNA ligase